MALEKQLAKFHLQSTSDHTKMHAAPPAEKCVMVDLHLTEWIHAMTSGSFIGFMALKNSRHSLLLARGVFVCLLSLKKKHIYSGVHLHSKMWLHTTKLCTVKFKLQAINPHTLRLRKPTSHQRFFKGEMKCRWQMPGFVYLHQHTHVWTNLTMTAH